MQNIRPVLLAAAAGALLALAGCATSPVPIPADLPPSLRAPAGQSIFIEALATGVQIYECAPGKAGDASSSYGWKFRAPEATLRDRSGQVIGKHYAGPTWESAADGSKVVGQVKASDPGPDPAAIPWLLLGAKASPGGPGILAGQVTSIQRLRTHGGLAPAQGCDEANAGQMLRVPYSATYEFYRANP